MSLYTFPIVVTPENFDADDISIHDCLPGAIEQAQVALQSGWEEKTGQRGMLGWLGEENIKLLFNKHIKQHPRGIMIYLSPTASVTCPQLHAGSRRMIQLLARFVPEMVPPVRSIHKATLKYKFKWKMQSLPDNPEMARYDLTLVMVFDLTFRLNSSNPTLHSKMLSDRGLEFDVSFTGKPMDPLPPDLEESGVDLADLSQGSSVNANTSPPSLNSPGGLTIVSRTDEISDTDETGSSDHFSDSDHSLA